MANAGDTTPDNLIVRSASEAQRHEVVLRTGAHWGANAGVGLDVWIQSISIFNAGEYARDGKQTIWILVPKDDIETLDFFASCQTYSRKVSALYPGQTSPTSEVGHAISMVLTPPRHRGKGYATRFMSLLHAALAPNRYPDSQALIPPAHPESSVSVLYSSVGHFYARCAPTSTSESGWLAQQLFKTIWSLSDLKGQTEDAESLTLPLMTSADVYTTLASDDENILTDLLERQKSDPSCTYFAFTESAALNSLSMNLSMLHPAAPKGLPWGARIRDSGDFMTWTFTARTSMLSATRLRATGDSLPLLLHAARRAAEQAGYKSIEAWNVPEHLAGAVEATGGTTVEREDHVSAFKWYGKQEGNSKVVWVLDERYAWC